MKPAGIRNLRHKTLESFCDGLKKYKSFILTCHVAPEGDAIGTILALNSLLKRLGKKTKVVCQDPFPERLSCLSSKGWNQTEKIKKSAVKYEAIILADCPTLDRIGEVKKLISPDTVIFNLDHHISNTYYGHYNYVNPLAAATGEVAMDIFKHLKKQPNKEEATNLYVALSTDTGSFTNGNTTVHSHRIAAELVGVGINLEKINEELYSTYSLNKINLYSRLLGRVKTEDKGRIAWVTMRREDLHHTGASLEDTEGFIDFLKSLKEVQIAFFVIESPNLNQVKVSFRAKGPYDVNKIAADFEGGGHRKAAACTIQITAEEAEQKVLERVRKEFR